MEEQILKYNREYIKTELALEEADFSDVLRELSLEEQEEFSKEQVEYIDNYCYLIKYEFKNEIETQMQDSGLSKQEIVQKLYEELKEESKEKLSNEPNSAIKYTLKSIKAEIEENLERPVKLSELEIILELSNLGLEDEYTDSQKQAIDKGLIKYLNQKSRQSSSSEFEGKQSLETLTEPNSEITAKQIADQIAKKTAQTETDFHEMIERRIPQQVLEQLVKLQETGVIAKKIEMAREKIAQQNRLNGKPTTIEIALTTDEQKHLPMKSAFVGDGQENGEKQE